jgi:ABC-type polysaccharide/polyol phosphate export permease
MSDHNKVLHSVTRPMFCVTPYFFIYDIQRETTVVAYLASYLVDGNISDIFRSENCV